METFFLYHPSSLIECVPANITWSGGTAPYSLRINLGSSSATIRDFDNILNTDFVWDTDVAAGTLVSFQILDARTAQVMLDPIAVGAGPNSTCVQDIGTLPPPSTSLSATLMPPFPSLSATPISSTVTYAHYISLSFSIDITALPPFPSFTPSPTAGSPIPSVSSASPMWYTNQQTAVKTVSLNGASTAGLAIGLVSLFTIAVWLWSRYRANKIRKRNNGTFQDAEKQDVAGGQNKFEAAIALWGDDESTTTSEDRPEDVPAPDSSNETSGAPSEDRDLTLPPTAPVSVPEDQPPTTTPSAPIQSNTPRVFSSRRTKRLQRPRLFSTTQSDTGTVSDTGAARLSSSTASGSTSTAPPSYRTRRSSVYAAPPPLPPPAYTPAGLPPPLGFGIPRRAGRGWLPTTSKLGQGRENALTSRGPESSLVLGTERRAESPGASEERIAGITFSDAKGGPPDDSKPRGDSRRLTSADTTDSVSETGATIRSADRED